MIDVSINGNLLFGGSEFSFPSGERHIRIPIPEQDDPNIDIRFINNEDIVTIKLEFEGSEDIVDLMLLRDIFRDVKNLELDMPYVPFSRQDRQVVPGEPNSLRAFAKFVNSLNFSKVYVCDPHSDVVEALFDRLEITNQLDCFNIAVTCTAFNTHTVLVSPDMGASKKTQKISEYLQLPLVQCFKKRCPMTGNITGVGVVDFIPHNNGKYIIVDDICDGGRTFIEVAKKLKELGAEHIDLYVTHGFFTKGMDVFDDLIDTVYCYNPMTKDVQFNNYSWVQTPWPKRIPLDNEEENNHE